MKFKQVLSTATIVGTLLLSSCKKEAPVVTPTIETFQTQINLALGSYAKGYVKDSTGYYELSTSYAEMLVRKAGNYFDTQNFNGADTTIPNRDNGEYDKIKFVSKTAISHEFNSPIAGNMTKSALELDVEFDSSFTYDNISENKDTDFHYSPTAIEKLKKLYTDQLISEYLPVVEKMMWESLHESTAELFTADEARDRYEIIIKSKVVDATISSPTITMNDNSAQLKYEDPLMFTIRFIGEVKIIK